MQDEAPIRKVVVKGQDAIIVGKIETILVQIAINKIKEICSSFIHCLKQAEKS